MSGGASVPTFIPGRELSQRFYIEVVRPLLDRSFPLLPHAAALIGPGSDVLGFDTEMSTDHDWGPRLALFLRPDDMQLSDPIEAMLRAELPQVFAGYPVSITPPADEGQIAQAALGVVDHRVVITTVREFVAHHLAHDLEQPLTAADWLTFPAQRLRELTDGAVHHDGVGELTALRQRLAWYPHDVWLYLLASGWNRIGQEEHLMPRAGFIGDELGSSLIGARLAHDVMSLCFLYARRYAPYPKWLGSAFQQLSSSSLTPILRKAQLAPTWQAREAALAAAYTHLAQIHNAAGITDPLPDTVSDFFSRPFQVIHGGDFAEAIRARIADPEVAQIAARRLIGNIDQISDNTDLHDISAWRPLLRALYT
jgi:Domain of unknown function (DUF4037)